MTFGASRFVAVIALCATSAVHASAQATVRVSVSSGGIQGNEDSGGSVISADGRYVAFQSGSANLVPGAPTPWGDVFVHDRRTGATERVSVDADGAPGNNFSYVTAMSPDARFVVMLSYAWNLVPGDLNGVPDALVRDRQSGTTERVSVNDSGVESNGFSVATTISADGRYVGFASSATNLVLGDVNQLSDIFVRDRQLGTTTCASVTPDGFVAGNGSSQRCSISADGRWLVFDSEATNLTADVVTNSSIFLRDLQSGTTTLVSASSPGFGGDFGSIEPYISPDGRWVTFTSRATNLVASDTNDANDIFVRDLLTGSIERASLTYLDQESHGASFFSSISADGRFVVFTSQANDFVPNHNDANFDVFVRDLEDGTTEHASVALPGAQVFGSSGVGSPASLSADGRFVAFQSAADKLVAGDYNFRVDTFVRDRESPNLLVTTYCTAKVQSIGFPQLISYSGLPSLSGDDAFFLTSWQSLPNKPATFFWGLSAAAIPFGGGTLCVGAPFVRSHVLNSGTGGLPGPGSGAYSFHFSQAHMAQHGLFPGVAVFGQFWSRDPGFAPPNNIGLTDAIVFNVAP